MFNGDYRLLSLHIMLVKVMSLNTVDLFCNVSPKAIGLVLRSAGKYGYGKQSLREPALMRPSSPVTSIKS